MAKTLIVSNRLPVQINKRDGDFEFSRSIGGLATGLSSVHQEEGTLWVGWLGMNMDELTTYDVGQLSTRLTNEYKCIPVFLTQGEVDLYYNCFSNKTIWPLFHYFPNLAEYEKEWWTAYRDVNRKFYTALRSLLQPGDTVWIQDYQLMLLPQMVRESGIDVKIGFFLHIPFPSFEGFRQLPWRSEIIDGLLGADLIGFHTYDYVRHFLSSIRRIKRLDSMLGSIAIEDRSVKVDAFPMGIDYERYSTALELKEVNDELEKFRTRINVPHVIFSVDRLDYTKGIPQRLHAYDLFLEKYSEWKEKVGFILVVAPSRTDVGTYMELKKELDELVSTINSRHGTIGWMPIWYYYRSFDFNSLTALFGLSDVLLVTPVRDGMNLVVKEYIATHNDKRGSVIISETTGAASELGEAFIVNANNNEEIADSINLALTTPEEEIVARNTIMHRRLERYNVSHWAEDFLHKLDKVIEDRERSKTFLLGDGAEERLITEFKSKKKRYLFLDYDGTLVGFKEKPELAFPDEELKSLLAILAAQEGTEVVIVSGRDRDVLDEWLGYLDLDMVAGHGVWGKRTGQEWECFATQSDEWKEVVHPVLDIHVNRTPGSSIEEKRFSLAWHYRLCEPDLADVRVSELKEALLGLTDNLNIGILEGNKVLEIKDTTIHKGRAVSYIIHEEEEPFILAAGDDWTDEDLFMACPENAWTVKIGFDHTQAHYKLESSQRMRSLLKKLAEVSL